MNSNVPMPIRGESCEDFCIRAHQALMPTVSDADQRNKVVWDAWDMFHPQTMKYSQHFSQSKYRFVPNVCHFKEHDLPTKGGVFRVGPNELKEICQNQNRRIKEARLYVPLIHRHTTAQDQENDVDNAPTILGYGVNFRMGMVGTDNQQFAIFGDEVHDKEHSTALKNRPRRSVELLRHPDSKKNFFDPVACLGGDAPRLDIPPAYFGASLQDGVEIERYSMPSVPAFPGGGNTFIRESYEQPQATTMTPEDINQIMDAMNNTFGVRLTALESMVKGMQSGVAPGQNGPNANAATQTSGASAIAPDALSLNQQPGQPSNSNPNLGQQQNASPQQFGNGQLGGGQRPTQYSAKNGGGEVSEVTLEQYQALVQENQTLKDNQAKLLEQIGEIRADQLKSQRERTDASRAYRIQTLSQKYSAIAANQEAEFERCLYSCGSEMSDDEFNAHIETIERYAAASEPHTGEIPGGSAGTSQAVIKERYSKEFQAEVTKVAQREMTTTGKCRNWSEIENEVAERLGVK
ncbi:MAG: hypothetical protein U0930_04880 [Pirellulales bacterium]